MAQDSGSLVSTAPGGPAWKQRAVERSTRAAKLRAEQRVQRFLDAAQAIITENGSTDFTVQEVVDRSRQSLRSFYQHFDGKHELLLALFEDALRRATEQIRAAAAGRSDPLSRLKVAVELLFELSRPDPAARRPLFTDFAPQLLLSYPAEVQVAHAPLLELLAELMTDAAAAGQLRGGVRPRRAAALTMQTVMFTAQSSDVTDDNATHPLTAGDTSTHPLTAGDTSTHPLTAGDTSTHPLTAGEVWDFCANGFARPETST